VGIWEYHLNDLDEDLVRDVNEYMPALMAKSWLKTKTKQMRVVPVAKSVSAEMAVMPFEAAEAIINKQSKIIVSDCICRKEQKMIGKGCDKPMEVMPLFRVPAPITTRRTVWGAKSTRPKPWTFSGRRRGRPGAPTGQPAKIDEYLHVLRLLLRYSQKPEEAGQAGPGWSTPTTMPRWTAEACARPARPAWSAARWTRSPWTRWPGSTWTAASAAACASPIAPPRPCCSFKKTADSQYIPPKNVFETYMNIAQERGLM
jgi:electron transport complex protein RnfB